jgi:hypothetical protein
VRLEGPLGEAILDFRYDDSWYPTADGGGHSLVCVDPLAGAEAWGTPSGWRPSERLLGTPGRDDSGGPGGAQVPGDINSDSKLNLSDAVSLLGFLFLGAAKPLPCGDGSLSDESNQLLLDSNGDGRVDITDAIHVLSYLFLGGPQPALGAKCVPVAGCPDVCGP